MSWLILKTRTGEQQVLRFERELKVGRGPHNDLVLSAADISWSHAALRLDADQVVIEDLGSSAGTRVAGVPIAAPTPVGPSDEIALGDTVFSLGGWSASTTGSSAYVLEDVASGISYPLRGGRLILGESGDADLFLAGERHAFEVGSTGVLLDGVRLELPWHGVLAGRELRVDFAELSWTPTQQPDQLHSTQSLTVCLEPPTATLVDRDSGLSGTVRAPTRVSLLYVLAQALEADCGAGLPKERCGWRTDEVVARGVWGKGGRGSSPNRLNTLVHRVRTELAELGFPRELIAKDGGWTRLVPMQVSLEQS